MSDLFTRSKLNPILKPNPKNDWEALKVYNCGAIFDRGQYHLFYRAVGKGEDWHSTIGHAVSADGENFTRENEPALKAENDTELRGVEDPRITKINDTYYMTYAAFDGRSPRLSTATSKDLYGWKKCGSALAGWKFEKAGGEYIKWQNGQPIKKTKPGEWSKSGGIFPEKINGKYWMLFGEYRIWLAVSDDLLKWEVLPGIFLGPRTGDFFDNTYMEMGPPPIKTDKGWLVLYHGTNKKQTYGLGFLLLDINNPEKILYRGTQPIFEPQATYELSGLVDILPGGLAAMETMEETELKRYIQKLKDDENMPCVIFCCGAVVVGDTLRIYYGAGDTTICTATAKLGDVLSAR